MRLLDLLFGRWKSNSSPHHQSTGRSRSWILSSIKIMIDGGRGRGIDLKCRRRPLPSRTPFLLFFSLIRLPSTPRRLLVTPHWVNIATLLFLSSFLFLLFLYSSFYVRNLRITMFTQYLLPRGIPGLRRCWPSPSANSLITSHLYVAIRYQTTCTNYNKPTHEIKLKATA